MLRFFLSLILINFLFSENKLLLVDDLEVPLLMLSWLEPKPNDSHSHLTNIRSFSSCVKVFIFISSTVYSAPLTTKILCLISLFSTVPILSSDTVT